MLAKHAPPAKKLAFSCTTPMWAAAKLGGQQPLKWQTC
jgi:hypothetical protein